MKYQYSILALFFGLSSQSKLAYNQLSQVEHHPSKIEIQLQKEKKELDNLNFNYQKLQQKFDVVLNELKRHKKYKPFAQGLKEEPVGEIISVSEREKFQPVKFSQDHYTGVRFIQSQKQIGNKFDLAGKDGPGLPEHPKGNKPLAQPRGEKQWQAWAQDLNDWSDKQTQSAQTRLPYHSTVQNTHSFAQNEPSVQNIVHPKSDQEWEKWAQDLISKQQKRISEVEKQIIDNQNLQIDSSLEKFSLAGKHGPGLPPFPKNNQPLSKPRGEKQWQGWAQNLNDWSDKQTKAAQTRIPYHSTLQIEDEIHLY